MTVYLNYDIEMLRNLKALPVQIALTDFSRTVDVSRWMSAAAGLIEKDLEICRILGTNCNSSALMMMTALVARYSPLY